MWILFVFPLPMKAILLAAGYATRLFPLTENFPKPLIQINWKPMMDYIVEKLIEIWINDVFVVTNNKYFWHFDVRAQWLKYDNVKLTILNDHTLSNDDRLGWVGDIYYAIQEWKIHDDIVVVGWDNIFTFSLEQSHALFNKTKENVIIAYDVWSYEAAKNFGIVSLNDNLQVTKFQEKPEHPESTLAAICLYYYPQKTLALFDTFMEAANTIQDPVKRQKFKDAPGNFPAWLLTQNQIVYASPETEKWYDIWSFESLKQAREDHWLMHD